MLALLRVAPGGCGFFPAFGAFRRTWANARWGAALDIAIRRERISLAAPPSRTWDAMAVETTAPRNRAVPETRIVDQFGRAAVGSVQAPLDTERARAGVPRWRSAQRWIDRLSTIFKNFVPPPGGRGSVLTAFVVWVGPSMLLAEWLGAVVDAHRRGGPAM
jgi:hypothetical protein